MASLGSMATKARALVHADITSYPDANLLIDFNIWYQKIASIIFESQDNSDFSDQRDTDYPIQTTPMAANVRDYVMPVSERMLKLKRVDLCYDGVNSYQAKSFDTGSFPFGIHFSPSSQVDTEFDKNFIQQAPGYDMSYNSIWIAPMPLAADVTAGGFIRAEWERGVVPFTSADYSAVLTDSTVIPGFDLPFHPILAYGAAYEFAVANNLPQLPLITQALSDWENRIRTAYGRKDLDMRLNLQADYVTYR